MYIFVRSPTTECGVQSRPFVPPLYHRWEYRILEFPDIRVTLYPTIYVDRVFDNLICSSLTGPDVLSTS